MNVQFIQMEQQKAKAILKEYGSVLQTNRDATYLALRQGYRALSKGLRFIDVGEVIKSAGLDHLKRPRLAICRADAARVYFNGRDHGAGEYRTDRWGNSRATRRSIVMPPGTFADRDQKRYEPWQAIVPLIPPPLRPPRALSNYHLLWEADWSAAVPHDPILLRRLAGLLFVVLAQWDLTPLEQAIMRGVPTAQ